VDVITVAIKRNGQMIYRPVRSMVVIWV
jgi:hypothetical protein